MQSGGTDSANRRMSKGIRGVRDTGKFPDGRSWADIMDDEKKAEEEKNKQVDKIWWIVLCIMVAVGGGDW